LSVTAGTAATVPARAAIAAATRNFMAGDYPHPEQGSLQ
jgi:hypothetical protein